MPFEARIPREMQDAAVAFFGHIPRVVLKSRFSYFTKKDSHFVAPSAFI